MIDNKCEQRPYYCTFTDSDGTIWFIPLSSQTEAYKNKIKNYEINGRECLFYHIGQVSGIDRVFLIGRMFPVTIEYIKKPYTIHNIHYVVANQDLIKQLHKKATKYLLLIKQGRLHSDVDIIGIQNALKNTNP